MVAQEREIIGLMREACNEANSTQPTIQRGATPLASECPFPSLPSSSSAILTGFLVHCMKQNSVCKAPLLLGRPHLPHRTNRCDDYDDCSSIPVPPRTSDHPSSQRRFHLIVNGRDLPLNNLHLHSHKQMPPRVRRPGQ